MQYQFCSSGDFGLHAKCSKHPMKSTNSLIKILLRATCEGASQNRWREDSIMGMVKGGASNLKTLDTGLI